MNPDQQNTTSNQDISAYKRTRRHKSSSRDHEEKTETEKEAEHQPKEAQSTIRRRLVPFNESKPPLRDNNDISAVNSETKKQNLNRLISKSVKERTKKVKGPAEASFYRIIGDINDLKFNIVLKKSEEGNGDESEELVCRIGWQEKIFSADTILEIQNSAKELENGVTFERNLFNQRIKIPESKESRVIAGRLSTYDAFLYTYIDHEIKEMYKPDLNTVIPELLDPLKERNLNYSSTKDTIRQTAKYIIPKNNAKSRFDIPYKEMMVCHTKSKNPMVILRYYDTQVIEITPSFINSDYQSYQLVLDDFSVLYYRAEIDWDSMRQAQQEYETAQLEKEKQESLILEEFLNQAFKTDHSGSLVILRATIQKAINFDFRQLCVKYMIDVGDTWIVASNAKLTGQTQLSTIRTIDGLKTHNFNCPMDLELNHPFSNVSDISPPKIMATVISKGIWGQENVVGFGSMSIPIMPGRYTLEIPTYMPCNDYQTQFLNYFVGDVEILRSTEYFIKGTNDNTSIVNKYGFTSKSSGSILLEFDIIHQKSSKIANIAKLAQLQKGSPSHASNYISTLSDVIGRTKTRMARYSQSINRLS